MSGLEYICPHCGYTDQTAITAPDKWLVERNPDRRHTCTACGRFAVPKAMTPISLDAHVHFMFSGCVNSYHCSLFDNYGADCENGLMTPKCLNSVFEKLALVEYRLDEIQGTPGHKRGSERSRRDGGA